MCLLAVCFYRKALDNNDLNQVWLTSGFVKRRVSWGGGGGRRCAQSRSAQQEYKRGAGKLNGNLCTY